MSKSCWYVVGAGAVAFLLMCPPQGEAQLVFWGGRVVNSDGVASPERMTGAPDGQLNGLGATGQFVNLGSFSRGSVYQGMPAMLGVPANVFRRANFIAFESNGGSPAPSGGWESSSWVFSDGTNSLTVSFNELTGTATPSILVANGSISGTDYRNFFGISSSVDVAPVISYILFRIPFSIDVSSPNFTAEVRPLPGMGEGTPDPDAAGVLGVRVDLSSPEP